MLGLVVKTVLVFVGLLIAADIAGVIVVTVIDILPLKFASAALSYAIWFVGGVFCGLFAYNIAGAWAAPKGGEGDWSTQAGAGRMGTGVLIVGALVIAAVGCLCYAMLWSHGVSGEDYVPDSEPHSIVFLVAVLGAAIAGRFFLMPGETAPKQPDVVG